MYIKTRLFNHLKWLNKAVAKMNGEAFLNAATLVVEVRVANKVFILYPMFTATLQGKKVYTHQFSDEAISFVGWKPYYDRPTPELGKKLAFKGFVEKHGLQTPAYSTEQNTSLVNVIVKKDISSFGDQIKGPFSDEKGYQLNAKDGEYFECFTLGNIVKIWYWNDKAVVLESQAMPTITGDGKSSVRELIKSYLVSLKSDGKIDWAQAEELLRYQGYSLDDVLPAYTTQLVDFRYISAFSVPDQISSVKLDQPSSLHDVLDKLGRAINTELLEKGQRDTIYSVDAIQDKMGEFWFLEVNFNPAGHPCLYPEMLISLTTSQVYRELRKVAK